MSGPPGGQAHASAQGSPGAPVDSAAGTIPSAPRRSSRRRPAADPPDAAAESPVASVALLLDPPHLARAFDYLVPAALSERAVPGSRVRVSFAGRLVDGFLLDRQSSSGFLGELKPLRSVVGAIPVLTQQVRDLVGSVAARYAGTFPEVVRFAVPPRHGQAEAAVLASAMPPPPEPGDLSAGSEHAQAGPEAGEAVPAGWSTYAGARPFFTSLRAGKGPRAVWVAAPGEQVGRRIAEVARAVRANGRGVVVVVPDAAALARVLRDLRAAKLDVEALSASAGPQARYSSFLRVLTGRRGVVVGTRAAVFAPVADCGLVVVWDDLDESLVEQQAPGWHAREVAALRSTASGCALLVGGHSLSVESANLVERGWAGMLQVPRDVVRRQMPAITAAGEAGTALERGTRLPPEVISAIRTALPAGPVLVSVPRAGYLPALLCQTCRERATCALCGRGLGQPAGSTAAGGSPGGGAGHALVGSCPQHGPLPQWRCPTCGDTRLRAAAVGVARTAEEIGRAFPGVRVLGSWASSRVGSLTDVAPAGATPKGAGPAGPDRGVLVVATPGCEPDPGPLGYSCAVILDAAAVLSRSGLRTGEVTLGRWLGLASSVRASAVGGRVLVVGPAGAREVQALIRWDPVGFARRELMERAEAGLPPTVRVVTLTGPGLAVAQAVTELRAKWEELSQAGSHPGTVAGLRVPVSGEPATADSGNGPGGQGAPAQSTRRAGGEEGLELRVAGPLAVAVADPRESPGRPAGRASARESSAGASEPGDLVRWIVSVPVPLGSRLAEAVADVQSARSARGAQVVVHRMDPRSLS